MQVQSKDAGMALLALLAETVKTTQHEHFASPLTEHSVAQSAEFIDAPSTQGQQIFADPAE